MADQDDDDDDNKKVAGEALTGTDHFEKAKRNTLFWSSALIVLELLNNGSPIKSPLAGNTLSAPPEWVGFLLLCALLYHFTGFVFARQRVIRLNSEVISSHRELNLAERPAAEAKLIDGLAERLVNRTGELKANIGWVRESFERLEATLSPLLTPWREHHTGPAMQGLDVTITDSQIRAIAAALDTANMGHSLPLKGRIEMLSDLEPHFSADANRLDSKLKNTYDDLRKIGSHIESSEAAIFRWYDVTPTVTMFAIAVSLFAADIVAPRPLKQYIVPMIKDLSLRRPAQNAKLPETKSVDLIESGNTIGSAVK